MTIFIPLLCAGVFLLLFCAFLGVLSDRDALRAENEALRAKCPELTWAQKMVLADKRSEARFLMELEGTAGTEFR